MVSSDRVAAHGVDVRFVRALRGPNLYAYLPVLHAEVAIGPYEERPSDSFPGFVERLVAWLPGLERHQCSVGRPGGFIERLRRGTYLGHIAEHVTLELQNMMGFEVAFGRARGTGETGVYNVVIQFVEEEPARAAFQTALELTLAAMHDEPYDVKTEIERLKRIADEYRLGPSTAAIVKAARARRIPVLRLTPHDSLVQLGYGVYQKRIRASETSHTSAIAVDTCQEKPLTNRMLRTVGVPVPDGRLASSADDAWQIAEALGLPVTVKPAEGNQGKGVSINLLSEDQVRQAYAIANQQNKGPVLVEQFIRGNDYRLLVIDGKLVAAARRVPAQVQGDGEHTVEELVALTNHDPRRRPGHSSILTMIVLDDAADLTLQQQGLTRSSVPAAGESVKLRNNSNLSTGGTAVDVTDEVHPRNVQMAELAAQIMALDIAGIDVICEDISRPLADQGGAIVEVNAAPGLRMHLTPGQGTPRDVATPIVEMLYPSGAPSRIPIIAITGTNGKTTVSRLIGAMYETAHTLVGLACTDGIYIDGELIMSGDCSGPRSAKAVLMHPYVEVAVLETARGGILREGLGFDVCTVGVVTNLSEDHLGLGGIKTLDDLAEVKQVVVEAVSGDGAAVLNADDLRVAEMAAATDAAVIYFSLDAENPIIQSHRKRDERCVFQRDGSIILATGENEVELVELSRIPFTRGGKLGFQVMNALAATAAAWASGLNPAMIVRALTEFDSDIMTAPGRFNVMDVGGVEVILDYGHNEAAMRALGEAVEALGPRRTVMALTLPGDRRDEDILATTAASAPFVDAYVLYDSVYDVRGRAPTEVSSLMRRALPRHAHVQVAAGQPEAMLKAWQAVGPGDRLIVIIDEVGEAIAILDHLNRRSDDASCSSPMGGEGEDSAARRRNGGAPHSSTSVQW